MSAALICSLPPGVEWDGYGAEEREKGEMSLSQSLTQSIHQSVRHRGELMWCRFKSFLGNHTKTFVSLNEPFWFESYSYKGNMIKSWQSYAHQYIDIWILRILKLLRKGRTWCQGCSMLCELHLSDCIYRKSSSIYYLGTTELWTLFQENHFSTDVAETYCHQQKNHPQRIR